MTLIMVTHVSFMHDQGKDLGLLLGRSALIITKAALVDVIITLNKILN